MRLVFDVLPKARQDIAAYGDYLAERSISAAFRFAGAIDATIQMLLQDPELGERLRSDPTGQIRYRTVSGFRNYLIFYRRVDAVLEIVRVLHGAMDEENVF